MLEGTALDRTRHRLREDHGPMLWEGERACTFSRRMAALGMAQWADVTDMQTGAWLEWPEVRRRHKLSSNTGPDHDAFKMLRRELNAKDGAQEWLREVRARWLEHDALSAADDANERVAILQSELRQARR